MNSKSTAELISQAIEGRLSEEDASALAELAREDASVLKELACHLSTHRLLQMLEVDPDGHTTAQEVSLHLEQERLSAVTDVNFLDRVQERLERGWWLDWRKAGAAAAAVALFALGAGSIWKWQSQADQTTAVTPVEPVQFSADGPPSPPRPTVPAMAVLKRGLDAVWANGAEHSTGELLPAGWLRLQSGTVQLEFLRGAQVILTGPAELRIDGENAAFLKFGKASAEVPEAAHGFSLGAPGMEVVDLGTAFGLDVPAVGGPEVHVFTGEVTLAKDGSNQTPQRLQERHAKRLQDGDFHDIPSRPHAFPDQRDLVQQEAIEAGQRRKAWALAMDRLANDPDALAVFTCEDETQWSRGVKNQAAKPNPESHGALVGAGWTGGRWPGKRGLEFRSQGDRLRFSVPGEYATVTCMASVRVDSLPNLYNSLLMPSRYETGAFHWTLERGGELRLASVHTISKGNQHHAWEPPISASAISDMDFGRWISLATTYDSNTGIVLHYRDGEMVGMGEFPRHPPVRLTAMEFGNWGARRDQKENRWIARQPEEWDTRNFVGRLDELVILQRALTATEIHEHYQIGKP
jgi:hypothetical protein